MSGEDRLRRLLSDAVTDIDPADRIDELRARVRPSSRVVPMSRSRSWYAANGVVATAAVIGVVAFVTHVAGNKAKDLGPASDRSAAPSATATAIDTADPRSVPATSRALSVYYLGHGPGGTVLFREQVPTAPGADVLQDALTRLAVHPSDPDYRTPWQPGWLVRATAGPRVITVQVGDVPAVRPAAMTARDASEALQQVVYTVQAATRSQAGVQFVRSGRPVSTMFGVATARPVRAGQALHVLSSMSITSPAEGTRVRGDRLVVSGVNDAYVTPVVVRLVRHGRTYVQRLGTGPSTYAPDTMSPWRVVLPTASLPPGRYTVVASNGVGRVARDTRTVLVR